MYNINEIIKEIETIKIIIITTFIIQIVANITIILGVPKICKYLKEYFYENPNE